MKNESKNLTDIQKKLHELCNSTPPHKRCEKWKSEYKKLTAIEKALLEKQKREK